MKSVPEHCLGVMAGLGLDVPSLPTTRSVSDRDTLQSDCLRIGMG